KQTYYEHGEKTSKLLSHQLSQAAASRAIPEIHTTSGLISADPKTINDQFAAFYNKFYTSEIPCSIPEIQTFLDRLEIPEINSENQTAIDAPITNQEILQAIKSMQSGKVPGPDGFPIEFYKVFSAKLVFLLGLLFKEIISVKKFPSTMSQAVISVLPKKDKDPLECGSYLPISLLC
ncbi:hypothetical protein LDENG_00213820, partial [Lucifuga dentata]